MSNPNAMTAMEVQQIMTREPTTAIATQDIVELYDLFEQVPYHHIPVVDGKQLIGILSDRDFAKCICPFLEHQDSDAVRHITVSEIMSKTPITVDKTTSINCASILLLENNISCLPVVDEDNALEGILTWKDILRFHIYY
tara:strand:- start:529 stop:948 length:420 start_codon:yes stop_codon:yes gene_type:complete